MTIVFALFALGVGISLLLIGYRLARFVIPLWGFLAGVALGGNVMTSMNDTPVLGTAVGIIVGMTMGLVFGLLAYLFYNVAIVVLMGGVGYWLGSSFVMLFGLDPGFLSVIIGLAVSILAAFAAIMFNAPKYVLIIGTSVAGALSTVGGLLVLFNQMSLEGFSYSAVAQSIENSLLWVLFAFSLFVLGVAFQAVTTMRYRFEAWALSDDLRRSHEGLTPHHGGSH
jgi:hypothetical protein